MFYKSVDVWKRNGGRAIRYRCFELLPTGRFCVQSADFYDKTNLERKEEGFSRQFLELLLEEAPEDRAKTFATLEEAIAWHDQQFA